MSSAVHRQDGRAFNTGMKEHVDVYTNNQLGKWASTALGNVENIKVLSHRENKYKKRLTLESIESRFSLNQPIHF